MNRKLDINNYSENGITWECLATVIQETGQQIVRFKETEGLNPYCNRYEEEIVPYKQNIMEYSREIARAGDAKEKERLILKKKGNEENV